MLQLQVEPSTKVEMVHSMHACLLLFVSCSNLLLHIHNVFVITHETLKNSLL